jgi:hypothetical protein
MQNPPGKLKLRGKDRLARRDAVHDQKKKNSLRPQMDRAHPAI